ncbi:beta-1,4-N-acetylgalactosaminyltransferase bre-4-like [Lingula anatina]|uniref:Beta-1,4-galactosyltransferase n=1 Tax=Lingula anatina TaxID=7574 RepID=A0A1S3H8P5_LINAN|nr:beta-1,4-N-acetylgalactosaminyltransferase bre-4-like [Lingula anatina]|eukprot:XP_013382383.1 beta-1,4-N-acetylgalactosaminyltransferase bre-4-like [Lingula anatina]
MAVETRVSVVMHNIMSNDLKAELFKDVTPGGSWFPKTCDALSHVAVIIPFRDRQTHLEILLQNLHPFLQHQKIHYTIFVIEQVPPVTFNRALLMNVGFVESQHTYNFSCYIFHDVDLIPENNQLLYTCPQANPAPVPLSRPSQTPNKVVKIHFGAQSGRANETPYRGYIGGVVAVSRETFTSVNGFSNVYFGWGGEDDDFRKRLTDKGIKIQYLPPEIGRYKAIAHGKDKTNPKNIMREFFLYHTKWLQPVDGLTSLRYSKVSLEKRPTYTLIRVNVSEEDVIEGYGERRKEGGGAEVMKLNAES